MDIDRLRNAARIALGGTLVLAGASHLSFARREFRSQVPETVTRYSPLTTDQVVVASGVAEIVLGATIALAPEQHRELIGDIAAVFFVTVLPGNISQLVHHRDAFGLDTDRKRELRLLAQPLMVAAALWSTRATQRTGA